MTPDKEPTPVLTTEQAKKLLTAIFADMEDAPDEEPADEEPIPDNYPETVTDKVSYSEFVLTNTLQYIGRAINRLSRLHRLLIVSEHGESGKLPDIITYNELRMALEPLLTVRDDVVDIVPMLVEIYRAVKPQEDSK